MQQMSMTLAFNKFFGKKVGQTLVEMDSEGLPPEIQDEKKGWEFVCENHHGTAYWNGITGEFCWVSQECEAKLSRLTISGK
jgi:hypothetical protein